MSKNRIKGLCLTIIIAIIVLYSSGYVGLRFYRHEKNQQTMIQKLQLRIEKLESEIHHKAIAWDENGFNYFAIGNSITKHELASYWWDDDRGMAASKDNADYVHLVSQYLKENNSDVITYSYNFSSWEVNHADRAEFLEMLDVYLSEKIDLITIQLGENAFDLSTWESDFEELIAYVQNKSPNANIIVIGDFWSNGERDTQKEQAAKNSGVMYVSLEGIKDNADYYAGIGTLVEDANGEMHAIKHSGVANHPGDRGMEAIAKRIIENLTSN